MSIEAIRWVFDWSASTGATRLVAVALANHARKDGSDAFPSLSTIAREAKIQRARVPACLRQLQDFGEIVRTGTRPSGTIIYRFPMAKGGAEGALVPTEHQCPQSTGVVPTEHSASAQRAPDPSLTVLEPSIGDVAALNGQTEAVVSRFHLVARERKALGLKTPLEVNVPRLIRTLNDFSHLTKLRSEALACAEWLLNSRKGRTRKTADRTLRTWLTNAEAKAPTARPEDDGW